MIEFYGYRWDTATSPADTEPAGTGHPPNSQPPEPDTEPVGPGNPPSPGPDTEPLGPGTPGSSGPART